MSPDTTASTSGRIAQFVSALVHTEMPAEVAQAARDRLVDTIGVGIAGSGTETARNIEAGIRSLHETGSATAWGTGVRLPAGSAALVNAAATHAEDFDDTHTAGVVHGSACAVPAAWAAGEVSDASVDDVIRGIVAGWEVGARLGIASGGAFHRRGLHTTSVVGVFAAAAAAAAVWQLSDRATSAAFGLAGSAAAGMNVYLLDGTSGKLLNPGFAAQAGLQAAALARSGVSGPAYVLDGQMGLYGALGDGVPDLDSALDDLGWKWEIVRVSVKPYPACHFSHAAIDVARQLRHGGLHAERVQSIRCWLPEPTFDLLCRPWEDKLAPRSPYAVKFSIPWLIALALVDGDITRSTFAPSVLERTDVRTLAEKVSVQEWARSPYPESFPGALDVQTVTGEHLSAERLVNRGHPSEPLSPDEIRAKFRDCVADRYVPEEADQLRAALTDPNRPIRHIDRMFTAVGGSSLSTPEPSLEAK